MRATVDAMRRTIFDIIGAPTGAVRDLNPGVTWNAWHVPTPAEAGVVAAFAAVFARVRDMALLAA